MSGRDWRDYSSKDWRDYSIKLRWTYIIQMMAQQLLETELSQPTIAGIRWRGRHERFGKISQIEMSRMTKDELYQLRNRSRVADIIIGLKEIKEHEQ